MDSIQGKSCYMVAVQRDFSARHFLFGGDWGTENELHTHDYRVEARLEGTELDEHGYLLDIVDIESRLEAIVSRYAGRTLNDLPEFEGLNPSIEHFARILWEAMLAGGRVPNLTALTIRIWENQIAWASFRREVL